MSQNISSGRDGKLRHELYGIFDDEELTLAEKRRHALSIGREYLDVENGHIQRRDDGETDTVVASVGDPEVLPAGTTLDRATTYCRRTVTQTSPVALSSVPDQGWADDPAYLEHGFDCYLGTTLFVRGEVYGTVCFVSRTARHDSFTDDEKAFVELIARLLGRALEARQYERRVTEERQARERTENKYETLVEQAPDAVFLADAETGQIVEANEAAVELTGYAESELESMRVFALHPSDQHEQYRELFESNRDGTVDQFDDGTPLLIRRNDGNEVPVEMAMGTVEFADGTYLQGVVRDISDRRERERDLRVTNRAIEEASVGITIADATEDDLPLVYANRAFERMTGYDREEVLGENCRFLQGPDTDEADLDELRAAFAEPEPVTTELLNYRADGTPFWNELTVAPVTDADGEEVTHFVGFQRDVTARKRRDRVIEVFDRVFRHNIRNDVTVIRGFADVAAERSTAPVSEMAARIGDVAGDLAGLSEKTRKLKTVIDEPASLEARDVTADVRAATEDLARDYPDIEFAVTATECPPVVATERLSLALYELGETAALDGLSAVTFAVEPAGDGRVAVHVRGAGAALSAADRQVLSEGRETPLEHGDGVGLWLVNWVVSGVGGTVTVTDGTTVTVELPAAPEGDAPDCLEYYRRAALSTKS